ncbi:Mitogen-activated protein [Vigna angularis]|uniref:non-specific serine/threonine protein kinase n=1 Tax=Phaseolus angularis TaxID=3914 RepID=A0A8T0KBW6_PHAAN|nr:Mitogen-activated protein [Vigna angularis]
MADIAGLVEAAGARFGSLELIGQGSFGDVYKGFDKELNKEVAIKMIDLEESYGGVMAEIEGKVIPCRHMAIEDEIEDIQKEISVLSQCRSAYITEYYGSFLNQTKLWIIMEYMAGGSVADLLQSGPPLDEMSIACILRDLLHAIDYLHTEGKIHRDIKEFDVNFAAANILLTENGDVKVADFGVSAQLTRTISRRKRPSAKELLRHRFIRNARKSPKLLERIRERPKFQIKEDEAPPRNAPRGMGEAYDTVKAAKDLRGDETNQPSISGSQGTGTFRSVSRPPQFRDKKTEVSNHQLTQNKSPESGYQVGSGNKNELLEASFGKDSGIPYHDEHLDDHLEDVIDSHYVGLPFSNKMKYLHTRNDELFGNGLGTVVVRSPKAPQSSLFRDQNSRSSSSYASFEDVSTSGTVVLRNQHDDSDSPQTPRSRLGLNNRNSNASFEDSATNLAEAKAAIQGGLRKMNVRDRFALGKLNNDVQESRRDQMSTSSDSSRPSREYIDAQKGISRSQYDIDDEESAKIISSSAPLSVLLIPSLKEAIAEDPEGPIAQIVINALLNMERTKPQSCDALVKNLLQRLASSKELSLKDLQELAGRLLSTTNSAEEARNAETDLKKKQNREIHSNSNLSPLARFLLSRWQGQASRDLNAS